MTVAVVVVVFSFFAGTVETAGAGLIVTLLLELEDDVVLVEFFEAVAVVDVMMGTIVV